MENINSVSNSVSNSKSQNLHERRSKNKNVIPLVLPKQINNIKEQDEFLQEETYTYESINNLFIENTNTN